MSVRSISASVGKGTSLTARGDKLLGDVGLAKDEGAAVLKLIADIKAANG